MPLLRAENMLQKPLTDTMTEASRKKSSASWQSCLNYALRKLNERDKLQTFSQLNTAQKKVSFCLMDPQIEEVLQLWLDHCLAEKGIKDVAKSCELRVKGNARFKALDNEGSLRLYTESLVHAPEEAVEFSLALANRSASLYHLGHYEECLSDINLALNNGYPAHLQQKLTSRQAECLKKLQHKVSKEDDRPPSLASDENKMLAFASDAIELRNDSQRGRHVISKRSVPTSHILFLEKPFASVLLPEHQETHCHHCYQILLAPFPCRKCTRALFCSESCRQEAWVQHHRWECEGLFLLHSVGVAHLALRIVLIAGNDGIRNHLSEACSEEQSSALFADKLERYPAVCSLMTHLDVMDAEDVLQYAMTASLLSLYLSRHTTFGFPEIQLATVLLRHVAQLVCNAHAITDLLPSKDLESRSVLTHTQKRVATAIFPSASMMNHSCHPNITHAFFKNMLVVRAARELCAGEEVFNCYGPHFARMNRDERQLILQQQYFFHCTCYKCIDSNRVNVFEAIQCPTCTEALYPDGQMDNKLYCNKCKSKKDIKKQLGAMENAQRVFHEAQELLSKNQIEDATKKFTLCENICIQNAHKRHWLLAETRDQLALCFASTGKYLHAVKKLKLSLETVSARFGPDSVEVAHEILKVCDALEGHLSNSAPSNRDKKILGRLLIMLNRAKQLLELHRGSWSQSYKYVCDRIVALS